MNELADTIAETLCLGGLGDARPRPRRPYRSAGAFNPGRAAKVRQAVPAPHHAEVDRLNHGWSLQPDLDGVAIAARPRGGRLSLRRADVPIIEVPASSIPFRRSTSDP